eukprot:1092568-Amphidinium_carterae.1
MDRRLRSNRSDYLEFLTMMMERGLLKPISPLQRKGFITPFFVKKKNGKQRLVLDCRMVNMLFSHAPYTELAAAEAFTGSRGSNLNLDSNFSLPALTLRPVSTSCIFPNGWWVTLLFPQMKLLGLVLLE